MNLAVVEVVAINNSVSKHRNVVDFASARTDDVTFRDFESDVERWERVALDIKRLGERGIEPGREIGFQSLENLAVTVVELVSLWFMAVVP